MAIISILYNEDEKNPPFGYEGISFKDINKKEEKIFNSGDIIVDWFNAIKFYFLQSDSPDLIFSSSVDHFIMDNKKYIDIAYLYVKEGEPPELIYDSSFPLLGDGRDITIFVNSGETPTWNQLKEYCQNGK